MAKLHGLAKGDLKGNAGQFSFKKQGSVIVMSGRIYENSSKGDGATEAQRVQRCKLANIVSLYNLIKAFEARAYEGKPDGLSDYNMFVKQNLGNANVYFPKNYANVNACVPARVVVAKGSLTPVSISPIFGAGQSYVTTGVALGTFEITDDTTVAQLSAAIIANNTGYENGDKITFGFIRKYYQTIGGVSYPFCSIEYIELQLDTNSSDYARDAFNTSNFEMLSANSFLVFDGSADAVIAVHTRMTNNVLQASNQMMVLPATTGANEFDSDEWLKTCMESYGYKPTVLIQPGEVTAPVIVEIEVTATASANGSATGSGTYRSGRNVTLVATPNSGYAFKGWYDNAEGTGTPVSVNASYTFVAPATDVTLYAVFAAVRTLTFNRPTGGSILVNGSALSFGSNTTLTREVADGGYVTLSASPATNYNFSSWNLGGETNSDNPVNLTISADMTISANFVTEGGGFSDGE